MKKTSRLSSKKKSDGNESTSDSGPDSDPENKPLKKTSKPSNKKNSGGNESTSDSGPDPDSDSEKESSKKPSKPVLKKKTENTKSCADVGLDSDVDSEQENQKKNVESTDSSKTKKKKVEYTDPHKNPTIIRLKKYVMATGQRVQNYSKFWDGCKNDNQRCQRLKQFLTNLGIEGRPTMEKCLKYKKKKQIAEEMADLEDNVVINPNGRALRRKNENVMSPVPSSESQKAFQRIKAMFDSDSE
ncbi:hypothetical protein FOCC_FOCC008976 [Frankliniella occidentalis]|nr:hypothetical protein FOCC_FOCC008976 [Frankliniella occidentalis]